MSDNRKKNKVMVAGHVCLDITPVFSSKNKVDALGDILAPGKLINVGTADIHTGGAVANTGLALKTLGADVTLAAKIGNDQFGQIVSRIFSSYGCEDGLIMTEGVDTSYSVVIAIPGIDRVFLHNPGANHSFCSADITEHMLEGISHFHIGYPPLMRGLYQNKGAELVAIMKKAKASGATTSLDMAAVDPGSESGQVDWEGVLVDTLPYVDFFVPSVEELGFMLSKELYSKWTERANGGDITQFINIEDEVSPLAERMLKMGVGGLLIKCGSKGMYYRTSDSESMKNLCAEYDLSPEQWLSKEGFVDSFYQPNVLSATGAGDTSIAAFLTSMMRGKKLSRCVELAAATGACCVASLDALSGLCPLEDLEARIEAGWIVK